MQICVDKISGDIPIYPLILSSKICKFQNAGAALFLGFGIRTCQAKVDNQDKISLWEWEDDVADMEQEYHLDPESKF